MSTYSIKHGYRKTRRKARFYTAVHVVATFGLLGAGIWHYSLPPASVSLKHVTALEPDKPPVSKITTSMPWPSYGQAAYSVAGGESTASEDKAKPVPIASLAKVITALAILQKKPLAPGEQGPMITLSDQDVVSYQEYLSKNGTVVPVVAGEQISQYQAMQAMLMSSANNFSDSLVRWAFGSMEAYNKQANEMVRKIGLSDTTIADASGFSPLTVSTAQDMVRLGEMYIQHPVLKQITAQPEATIPVAGTIPNYNTVINKDGLLGIKVGFTDEAGRCFMLANIQSSGTRNIVSLTVVLGAENINIAMHDAEQLIKAGDANSSQVKH